MAEAAANPVILVLGMHRSGTSMLTAGLRALGVGLGDHLMPPRAGDNDKGYFENPDIVALNERLLEMDGFHWASLAYGTPIDYGAERYAPLRAEAAAIITGQLGPGLIAIKDPRLCLTLPFWQRVIATCRVGAPVWHLHLFRHPVAIAASLMARVDGANATDLLGPLAGDETELLLLWLSYTYQALRNSRDRVNWCLQQDALLRDPAVTLCALADGLGLEVDVNALSRFVSDFVDPALTHHRSASSIGARLPSLAFLDAIWTRLQYLHGPLSNAEHAMLLADFPDLELAFLWSVQARRWLTERARCARLAAELEAKQLAVDVRDEKLIALYRERDALAERLRTIQRPWLLLGRLRPSRLLRQRPGC